MKKFAKIGSALAAVLVIAGAAATSVFAVSAPGADAEDYSYNTGRQAWEERTAEEHALYDHGEDAAAGDHSYLAGCQAAVSRSDAFAGMPEEENAEKEDIEAWFESNGLGEGSAWSEGEYDETAVSSYGYAAGQAAYQQRHAAFAGNG